MDRGGERIIYAFVHIVMLLLQSNLGFYKYFD